ncbi:MAG: DMT family transporter [Quinella sp. 3Q1]|nr:DMT family transporter [Quinella sp. 3Q1]MBR6887333.1 DMT family transporter [Selenomonadaceae bacterium]
MLRALAAIWLIWGLNWVVMKTANTFFPPILFVTWRFATGALILLAVAYWRKIPFPDKKFLPWIILTGVLMIVLNNIAAQIGMLSVSAGMAAVLNYTAPLWTAILAHFALNERLTKIKCVGIFSAILGLYVLMGLQGVEDLGAAFIIILGAIFMAVANIVVKLRLTKCDMVQLTTWQMVFGAIVLVGYSSLFPQGEINWCLPAVLCVLYNGALASALAFFLWNYVLTHIEASSASIATLVAPIVGVLGGVFILGEPFTVHIVLGMALIFAGILIVVKKSKIK